jgi:hypothetical protein
MTLQTASDTKTWYWVLNSLTFEQIKLRPAAGGQTADLGMGLRYGHQIEGLTPTGYASWTLGSKSTYIVLSAAAIATLAATVSSFGSTGVLSAPVWLQDGDERTLVQQNNNVTAPPPPLGDGQSIAQLELQQGSNVVLLSKANCVDLAATLATIGAT